MGKYFVPATAMTPGDSVREALARSEQRLASLRKLGAQALELLHLFDQISDGLEQLKAAGVDVRAEETRFETVQRQLDARKSIFMAQVRSTLDEERRLVQPGIERWWWYLDTALTDERKRRAQRNLKIGIGVLIALAVAWIVYDRFIAPPQNVRDAYQRASSGESLVEAGDLEGALAEFQAAVALNPEDADHLVWTGVVYQVLGKAEQAEVAFGAARALFDSDLEFLLSRGMKYVRIGDLDAAEADARKAIEQYPDSGWAYTLLSSVAASKGDYTAAVEALDQAAEMGAQTGDSQLEAYARTQRAMMMQLQMGQMPADLEMTATPAS